MPNKFEKYLPPSKPILPQDLTPDMVKKMSTDFAMAIQRTFNEYFQEMKVLKGPNPCFEAYQKTLNDIFSHSQAFLKKNPQALAAIRKPAK